MYDGLRSPWVVRSLLSHARSVQTPRSPAPRQVLPPTVGEPPPRQGGGQPHLRGLHQARDSLAAFIWEKDQVWTWGERDTLSRGRVCAKENRYPYRGPRIRVALCLDHIVIFLIWIYRKKLNFISFSFFARSSTKNCQKPPFISLKGTRWVNSRRSCSSINITSQGQLSLGSQAANSSFS